MKLTLDLPLFPISRTIFKRDVNRYFLEICYSLTVLVLHGFCVSFSIENSQLIISLLIDQ